MHDAGRSVEKTRRRPSHKTPAHHVIPADRATRGVR
jgi:hypothetical protein